MYFCYKTFTLEGLQAWGFQDVGPLYLRADLQAGRQILTSDCGFWD